MCSLAVLHGLGRDDKGAFDLLVLVRVFEALFLDAGDIEHIGLGQDRLQAGVFGLRDALLVAARAMISGGMRRISGET